MSEDATSLISTQVLKNSSLNRTEDTYFEDLQPIEKEIFLRRALSENRAAQNHYNSRMYNVFAAFFITLIFFITTVGFREQIVTYILPDSLMKIIHVMVYLLFLSLLLELASIKLGLFQNKQQQLKIDKNLKNVLKK